MALHLTMYAGLGPRQWDSCGAETQETNRLFLGQILDDSDLPGCTIVEGRGVYDGHSERCVIVSVICPDPSEAAQVELELRTVAENYKAAADQEAVWITRRVEDLIVV
jgi:hypothetical protein